MKKKRDERIIEEIIKNIATEIAEAQSIANQVMY